MKMLLTLRKTIDYRTRQVLVLCGMVCFLAISADRFAQGEERNSSRVVTAQGEQSLAPVVSGKSPSPEAGIGTGSKSDPIYADGDVIYEGPHGMEPWGGGYDMFPGNFSCPPGWMVTADALFLNRSTDTRTSLSNGFRFDDFGYDLAGRITLNRRFDCLVGWEASYLGPFEWNQSGAAAGAGLNTFLGASGINMSAFNAAVSQQEVYTSFLQSAEFSQKWWGWDVISTSAGMRYINLEEDLLFTSTNALAETGALAVQTNNHLVGGQVGLDLFFPVGRVMSTTRFRASAYANFMDSTTVLSNAGALQVNTDTNDVDFASLLEVGYYFSYYITPRVSLRAGYEVMWLYGLALAPGQLTNPVGVGTGSSIDRDGDIFFHGGTAGVEVSW